MSTRKLNCVRPGAWMVMTGSAMVLLGGCGPDPRMSVDQFLALQRQMAEAQPSPAEDGAPAPDYSAIEKVLGPYRVGPGDTLNITIAGTNLPFESPVQARVDRDGNIALPLVGRVPVADHEIEDVEVQVTSAFVAGGILKDVAIHVELGSFEGTKVLIVGAVQLPGFVRLRRTERNLLMGVVMAGGVTADATGRAKLRRLKRPGEEWSFDLTDPAQVRAALNLEPIENGDMILVEASPRAVFVGGLVNAPGPVLMDAGIQMNLLQAIAASGGLRTDITPREGTLIRHMPDGTDAMVKIDLDKLAACQAPNLQLAAGDILWVPHTAETRIQDWVNRNIFLRAGASVNYNVTGIEFLNRRELQGAGRGNSGGLQDSFDPFGFLLRNQALQQIQANP